MTNQTFYIPFIWRGKPENKKQGSSDEEIEFDITHNKICKRNI